MQRKLSHPIKVLFLGICLLVQNPGSAAGAEFIDIPDTAVKAMALEQAMDLVSLHMGHYWLRSLRWTCPYVIPGGERRVDHYGVRLENFVDVDLELAETGPSFGTIYFAYPYVQETHCRIPYNVSSRQEAVDLAAAFRKLSREPGDRLREAIATRYYLDTETATSIDRFLTTEVSIEIAKLLLQEQMQSLVRPGGAGQFIPEPAALSVGSDYTVAADYVLETREPNSRIETQFRLLTADAGELEVQMVRAGRVTVCRDRNLYRAISHEGASECRSETNAKTTTSFVVNDGQVSYLPVNTNTATFYEAESDEAISFANGREVAVRQRYLRACYAEALESVTVPAGSFDTVRFLCGSLRSDSARHQKQFGPVWVDRSTGIPVKSEMQVHAVYRSQRYQLNEAVISLNRQNLTGSDR